ncbi:TylF/MycF family methyltransferase [Patescibacteria group bacterium]|nr:TylF/MycF family methyltransferase [Patescibacteria group bacterium]
MKDRIKRFAHCVNKILLRHHLALTETRDQRGRIDLADSLDYIRYATLERAAYEVNLRKVRGDIAEVGVYQGRFAAKMNQLFPDREFYLFDTFEGFDERDIAVETQNGIKTLDKHREAWRDTSEEKVLGVMAHPRNCVIKKGYFPETAKGLENKRFAFVSLDADLWEPTYNGLKFFYPRLEKGGYIFIHDCAGSNAGGALRKFSQETGVPYLMLPDAYGTAVIAK